MEAQDVVQRQAKSGDGSEEIEEAVLEAESGDGGAHGECAGAGAFVGVEALGGDTVLVKESECRLATAASRPLLQAWVAHPQFLRALRPAPAAAQPVLHGLAFAGLLVAFRFHDRGRCTALFVLGLIPRRSCQPPPRVPAKPGQAHHPPARNCHQKSGCRFARSRELFGPCHAAVHFCSSRWRGCPARSPHRSRFASPLTTPR